MALSDKLPWLKLSSEPSRPKTTGEQVVHFLLSLVLLAVALSVSYLVVMSETKRTLICDTQACLVKERAGLFATPPKIAKARKPVSFEAGNRNLGGLAVLMIDADGESEWITPPNEEPAQVRKIASDLKSWPDGKDYVITTDGFGFEWYIACILLLLSCFLNLRNSVRWFLATR